VVFWAPRALQNIVCPRRAGGVIVRPLNFTVRQPVGRRLRFLVLCLTACAAVLALDGGEWFEVAGGAWEPDAATIRMAKPYLKEHMDGYFGHKLTRSEWGAYSFQYQGTSDATGRHLIHINAFRKQGLDSKQWDFKHKWLRVDRGGSWFFQADFDPATGSIINVAVNSP
jgi:hypothetical protein